jgi:hypothetical protein
MIGSRLLERYLVTTALLLIFVLLPLILGLPHLNLELRLLTFVFPHGYPLLMIVIQRLLPLMTEHVFPLPLLDLLSPASAELVLTIAAAPALRPGKTASLDRYLLKIESAVPLSKIALASPRSPDL